MTEHRRPDIRAVLLDLGNVIIELDFPRLYRALGFPEPKDDESALKALNEWHLYDAFERGAIDEAHFFSALGTYLGRRFTRESFLKAWNTVFVRAVPGIEPLLKRVAARVPLFGLTNSNVSHIRYCHETYPEIKLFRQLFTSYEFHARKPEPAIFEATVKAMSLRPDEIVYVDDRTINLEAAALCGLHAEHCCNSASSLQSILEKYLPGF